MFISYKLDNSFGNKYGYMCFKKDVLDKIDLINVQKYLEDCLWKQNSEILYIIRLFNEDIKKYHVYIYTDSTDEDGVYRTIEYDGELKDVEDIGKLYIYLHDKYGFTNILGFVPRI